MINLSLWLQNLGCSPIISRPPTYHGQLAPLIVLLFGLVDLSCRKFSSKPPDESQIITIIQCSRSSVSPSGPVTFVCVSAWIIILAAPISNTRLSTGPTSHCFTWCDNVIHMLLPTQCPHIFCHVRRPRHLCSALPFVCLRCAGPLADNIIQPG